MITTLQIIYECINIIEKNSSHTGLHIIYVIGICYFAQTSDSNQMNVALK